MGEVHRRARFVHALGHGVLSEMPSGGATREERTRRLVAACVVGSLPILSLDHPVIVHKWPCVARLQCLRRSAGPLGTTVTRLRLFGARNGLTAGKTAMIAFFNRFWIHYDIYRRYPLSRVPALRNAWRIAR